MECSEHSLISVMSNNKHSWMTMCIYGCVFFSGVQILVRVGSSSSANHTHESYPEPYPESYLRIIPPKITIMNVSFGIVWDCIGLTSYNGPDKLIDQCWPDPMIPGYLHIPSRSGESSPRAQSLIIIPKLAGSGWLAGWLGGWLSCCCWYRAG